MNRSAQRTALRYDTISINNATKKRVNERGEKREQKKNIQQTNVGILIENKANKLKKKEKIVEKQIWNSTLWMHFFFRIPRQKGNL